MARIVRNLITASACAILGVGCASISDRAPEIDAIEAISAADMCVCELAGEERCSDGFEVSGGWHEYYKAYRFSYQLWLADYRDHHVDIEVQVSTRGRVGVLTGDGKTAPCDFSGDPEYRGYAVRPRRALEIALAAGMGDDEHAVQVTLVYDRIKNRALWRARHRVPAQPRDYEDVIIIDAQTGVVVDRFSEPIIYRGPKRLGSVGGALRHGGGARASI